MHSRKLAILEWLLFVAFLGGGFWYLRTHPETPPVVSPESSISPPPPSLAEYARELSWAALNLVPAVVVLGLFAFVCVLAGIGVAEIRSRWKFKVVGQQAVPVPLDVLQDHDFSKEIVRRNLKTARAWAEHQQPRDISLAIRTDDRRQLAFAEREPLQLAPQLPGVIDMANVLDTWQPSKREILLGIGPGGQHYTVTPTAMRHVAKVGPTGDGKTYITRLLLSQWLAVGYQAALIDPKYTPLDAKTGEDWRPIAGRLLWEPARNEADIRHALQWLVDEVKHRRELRHAGQLWGPPILASMDELQWIVKEVKEAAQLIEWLIRVARSFDVFVDVSATDFLVATVKTNGAARENYKTAYYLGGDKHSGSILLDMQRAALDDAQLAIGLAFLRSAVTPQAQLVRVPLASNEAVERLLGSGGGSGLVVAHEQPLPTHPRAIDARSERVRSLLVQKRSQNDILAEVWGVTAKGGREYQRAAEEYRAVIASLVEV